MERTDKVKHPCLHTDSIMPLQKGHHPKNWANSRETKAVLECITDASLTDKQRKALKCSYKGLLNNAELEAQKIKKDRDDASQSKLEEHLAKRQRTESYKYDIDHTCTNPPTDVEHFTEVLTREETHTDPGVIPTGHNRCGGPKRKNRRHRLIQTFCISL